MYHGHPSSPPITHQGKAVCTAGLDHFRGHGGYPKQMEQVLKSVEKVSPHNTHIQMYIHVHTYAHTHAHTHTCTHIDKHTHNTIICTQTYIQHTHARKCTHMHTHMHTHTHTYTHTHTQTQQATNLHGCHDEEPGSANHTPIPLNELQQRLDALKVLSCHLHQHHHQRERRNTYMVTGYYTSVLMYTLQYAIQHTVTILDIPNPHQRCKKVLRAVGL